MAEMHEGRYAVGGVLMDRPFRIQRLGHFGLNAEIAARSVDFYTRLLGFRVSDEIDFTTIVPGLVDRTDLQEKSGFFLKLNSDHHSLVIFPRPVRKAMDRHGLTPPEVTINQLTWQVGSLRQVVDATEWLAANGRRIARQGRDIPGSNWHVYFPDPDGHLNEFYFGIEQIGWDGLAKPRALFGRSYAEAIELPQPPEQMEIDRALQRGVRLGEGHRALDPAIGGELFDVSGTLLPRPFRVVQLGPVNLFVGDVDGALAYYRDELGLRLSETVRFEGHSCHFLRANTEHHSLGLFPLELRGRLDLSPHTTCMSFGVRVADYRQLREARAFLEAAGVPIRELPAPLSPGMDRSFFAFDPDGHAVQFYFHMEQIGWDGVPRPGDRRAPVEGEWPDFVEEQSDSFGGEVFFGPWG